MFKVIFFVKYNFKFFFQYSDNNLISCFTYCPIFAVIIKPEMKKQNLTIHDIAKELNTTASTVSRALQDHPRIGKKTKERIQQFAKENNYQPNSYASGLRKGKGNTLGVIVPQINRNFFSTVIRGLEDVASAAGYNVLICQSHNSEEKEKAIVETLINGTAEGIIVSLAANTFDMKHFDLVKERGIPLVFFDRTPNHYQVDTVVVDDFLGSYRAVQHLIDQGCTSIAHIGGAQHIGIYRRRFEGYRAALDANGLSFNEDMVSLIDTNLDTGTDFIKSLFDRSIHVDGISCAGDYAAFGAMVELKRRIVKIPHEVAVIGFSNEPYNVLIEPGLSSIDQHCVEIGRSAANLFLERIAEKHTVSDYRSIVIDTELCVRTSSLKREFVRQ